jgi:hypothetical protein
VRLGYVVLVKILFAVVPADSVKRVFDLEDHRAETTDCGKVVLSRYRFLVRVENEAGLSATLSVETTENQNARRIHLVCHSEITWDPALLILDLNNLPHVPLDVIAFTDICYLLR